MFKIFDHKKEAAKKVKIQCVNEPELSDGDDGCLCGCFLSEIERRLKRVPMREFDRNQSNTQKHIEYIKKYSYTFKCTSSENRCVRSRIGRILQSSPKLVEAYLQDVDLKGLAIGSHKKRLSQIERVARQEEISKESRDEWDAADEALAYAFDDLAKSKNEEQN